MYRRLQYLCLLLAVVGVLCSWSQAADRTYQHVVVLADPHIPGKNLPVKEQVIRTINAWEDVDLVAVVGDICEDSGTAAEYAAATQFFAALKKPAEFVTGNHDYIYEDVKSVKGDRTKATPGGRAAKLVKFRDAFGMADLWSTRHLNGYVLLFLSVDHLLSRHLTELSGQQLAWLRSQLENHRSKPTVVFFHAPLMGTLVGYNENANTPNFVAQPEREIREILRENPQVILWIAGHMHVPATNESYRADINVFEGRVRTIHVTDMQRERIWTTSLFLFPDRVVIKTFDHKKGAWVEALERTVTPQRP